METVWIILIRRYECVLKVLAAAMLVAHVTSQVGISGIMGKDGPSSQGGLALIWPNTYSCLIILNTMAFYGSLNILILLTAGDFPFQIPKALTRWIVIVWATISSVSLAYTAALSVLISNIRNYEDFEDDSIFRILWSILAIWSLPTFPLLLRLQGHIWRNMRVLTDDPMAAV